MIVFGAPQRTQRILTNSSANPAGRSDESAIPYGDMASHYGTAVLPAQMWRPRDKAKVEVAVQVVKRWALARLRHRRFFCLAEPMPAEPYAYALWRRCRAGLDYLVDILASMSPHPSTTLALVRPRGG